MGRVVVDINDDDAMPFELPMPPRADGLERVPAAETSWWSPVSERRDESPSAGHFPIPPSAPPPEPNPTPTIVNAPAVPAVPTWAVRGTAPVAATARYIGDLAIDPMSLRPKLTLRAGFGSLRVDDHELVLRSGLRRERLPWTDVGGFEPHFPDGASGPAARGVLVALTPMGAVELPATRRLAGELPHIHALLDAYRLRALAIANS